MPWSSGSYSAVDALELLDESIWEGREHPDNGRPLPSPAEPGSRPGAHKSAVDSALHVGGCRALSRVSATDAKLNSDDAAACGGFVRKSLLGHF